VKQASERDFRYQSIMRNLVRRYVTVQQRKAESQGVTEDDVNEIKQDISAFRCELVEILKNSGMNTSTAAGGAGGAGGKKNRQKERRLMKGFNVAPSIQSTSLTPLSEHSGSFPLDHHGSHDLSALSGLFGPGITPRKNPSPNTLAQQQQHLSTSQSSFGDSIHKLGRFAPKFHSKRNGGSHKRKWGNYEAAAVWFIYCQFSWQLGCFSLSLLLIGQFCVDRNERPPPPFVTASILTNVFFFLPSSLAPPSPKKYLQAR
jgi:transient receptor potential cation channel subfamily C protein 4